jgi:hypothetical protein
VETILNVMKALSIPLIFINMLGGIVSGIWLAIIGEWGTIGWGFAFLFGGALAISLAMMPGLMLAAPLMYFEKKGSQLGFYFFGFLMSLYTVLVIAAWCCVVLMFFAKRADSASIIPTLLWSYGAATGPLAYMAQKEQNEYAGISTFFAQFAYLTVVVTLMFTRLSVVDAFIMIGAIMGVGLIFQTKLALDMERLKAREA